MRKKRVRQLDKLLGQLGEWDYECRRKHILARHAETGAVVTACSSPSDPRSDLNLRSQARRAVEKCYG